MQMPEQQSPPPQTEPIGRHAVWHTPVDGLHA
jgi:hypothetical protein